MSVHEDSDAQVGQGMALMVGAVMIVPGMDAIAKLLSPDIPPVQINVARYVVQSALALALCFWGPWRAPLMNRSFAGHALRGVLASGATLAFFAAVGVMPLANALAIFFVEPLILTALGALLLKETVGPRRWAAVGIGLVGALIVLRPNWAEFGATALLPLCAAVLFSGYLLLTRHMARTAPTQSQQFMSGVSAAVLMSVTLLATTFLDVEGHGAAPMNGSQTSLLLLLGLIGFFGHLMVVLAFARAPASVLAPLNYLEIVSATILGLILFGDFPDLITWAGVSLIIASGLYVANRERLARTVRNRPSR